MNLWYLEVFREVMRADSVSKAAQNLGRTQPAVSATLAKLERHIGYELFERKSGRLHPVPEAHYLLAQAEKVLEQVNAVERTMRTGSGLEDGRLQIACMPAIAEHFMPELISRFALEHPNARFSVHAPSSDIVYDRIAAQQFDVGLAECRDGGDLVNEEVFEVNCVCAFAADDPLAERAFVTPADLDGRACACFLPGHFIVEQLQSAFRQADAHLNIQFELQNGVAQYPLIANGLAYGMVSPLAQSLYRSIAERSGGIRFVPMVPAIVYRFAILTPAHRTLSRLAQAFVSSLREAIRSMLRQVAMRDD